MYLEKDEKERQNTLPAEFNFNPELNLTTNLKRQIENTASWLKKPVLYKGRSGIITLLYPIEIQTNNGILSIRAVKIKGLGDFNNNEFGQPKSETHKTTADFHAVVDDKGHLYPKPPESTPQGGITFKRAQNEYEKTKFVFDKDKALVATPLGYGKYPSLTFLGDNLGFVILGIPDANDLRFADILDDANFDERTNTLTLGEEMGKRLSISTDQDIDEKTLLDYFSNCYRKWGAALRKLNDTNVLHLRNHSGNYTITSEGQVIIYDLDASIFKSDLETPESSFMYQLYSEVATAIRDISQDITYTKLGIFFSLRKGNPYKAFLEGYFGEEFFNRENELKRLCEELMRIKRPQNPAEYPSYRFNVEQMAALFLFKPLFRSLNVTPPYSYKRFTEELDNYRQQVFKFQDNIRGK